MIDSFKAIFEFLGAWWKHNPYSLIAIGLGVYVFFARIAASAVVIDHVIEGDGSRDGRRTLQTALPEAIRAVDAEGVDLEYRDRMVEVAEKYMPGRVGVNVDGFAGRYGKAES